MSLGVIIVLPNFVVAQIKLFNKGGKFFCQFRADLA